ncbi:hypothetical protein BJ138DRAFT_168268 [Hygrophoropsis aurantiaca]|uniref:Uncharacterized protein n=1 Tax=Hygrophoropsis aurantiaca TaxID=72124 RepID=A0ACB8AA05_9AGAM|nr:hypothetical protein BJ138DRAFT_168268 [Hygrophoropsis aurantiaca]
MAIGETVFQDVVKKAAAGSVDHLTILSVKCDEFPAQSGVILPIFCAHLNPALIPKQITPETTRVIILAKWSLIGIINFCTVLGEPEEQVFEHIIRNWTRLYPWIPFFYRNFLVDLSTVRTRLNSPVSISEATKVTAGFLAILYDKYPISRSRITNTPALHTTIMGIWHTFADLQPCDIDLDHPNQNGPLSFLRESISMVVAYCLASSATVSIFPAFVTAAGGMSMVVDTTLRYLRLLSKEVNDLKEPGSKAESVSMLDSCSSHSADFAQITQILLHVSKRGGVAAREEFISKGSVHIMASTLARLRAKLLCGLPDNRTYPHTGFALRSLYNGCQYIEYAMLESDDGTSVLCEALEARILETILQAGHMESEHTPYQQRDRDSDVVLLSQLPTLLMHSKVLRIAAKCLSRIKSQDIERKARRDRVLFKAWDNFKNAVARYLQTEKRLRSIEKPTYESTCGGDQECISRDETSPELYRCSGCLTVKYCSRHCQRTDWKRRHKSHCRVVRLAIGTPGSHDIRRNILTIASIETEQRIPQGAPLERFLDDAQRANPDYHGEVIAELDLTVYPFVHSVQPLGRYRNIFMKDYGYEEIFQIIRSDSRNIFEIVKLRQGNTVHYLLSPGTLLKAIFNWPPG